MLRVLFLNKQEMPSFLNIAPLDQYTSTFGKGFEEIIPEYLLH